MLRVIIKMKNRHMCAVLGPTQFGKSSFINAISNRTLATVGSRSGRSCTSEITLYEFPDCFSLFNPAVNLICFDVPGFNDTDFRIKNSEILSAIKYELAGQNESSIDALFVFQSLNESSVQLERTLSSISEIFGESVMKSVIVVLTKSDLVTDPLQSQMKMATVKSICRKVSLRKRIVVWVNSCGDQMVATPQKDSQLRDLRRKLLRLEAYSMNEMRRYQEEVDREVLKLKANDPNGKVVTVTSVPAQRTEEYNTTEKYNEQQVVPKYPTFNEQRNEAIRRQSLPINRTQVQTNRAVKLIIPAKFNIGFVALPVVILKDAILTQNISVPRPLENIIEEVKREMKTILVARSRTRKNYRVVNTVEQKTVTTDRFDMAHYRKAASKKLAQRIWSASISVPKAPARKLDF